MNPELETEGIGQLPQQAQQKLPRIPSKYAYDAAIEAVGQIAPEAVNVYRGTMRSALAEVEIPPKIVDILIAMFEYLRDNQDQYETVVSTLVQQGIIPPSMLPDRFDQTYIGTRLAALNELKQDTAERSMPIEGMPMAQGGLADVTKYLQSQGRGGDTILAHINPEEAALLKSLGGSGTVNPNTGLPEFKPFYKKVFDVNTYSNAARDAFDANTYSDAARAAFDANTYSDAAREVFDANTYSDAAREAFDVNTYSDAARSMIDASKQAFDANTYSDAAREVSDGLAKLDDTLHEVVASPVGRMVATVGLTMLVGPVFANMAVSGYAGGDLKDVLVAGAMGYIGSGGTVMGINPLNEISQFVQPIAGAQGTLLNTALTSAAVGTGGGLLQGQSVEDALTSGALSGASSGVSQGFGGNPLNIDPKNLQTFSSFSTPNAYSASGNNAAQYIDGKLVPGSGGGIPPPSLPKLGVELDPTLNYAQALKLAADYGLDESVAYPYKGRGAQGASVSALTAQEPILDSVSSIGNQSIPTGTTLSTSPVGQGTGPISAYMVDDEGLNPLTAKAGTKAGAGQSSLISRTVNFYDDPSFDNFGKIFVDPNATTMFGKYGPGLAAAAGATALAGGFKSSPAERAPLFETTMTGEDYKAKNPQKFGGDLRAGQYSRGDLRSGQFSGIPTGIPTGEMYFGSASQVNAPRLPTYNSSGPVMGRARGGNIGFPRKTGQIDGPGTETSDSIPAMLSDGEFVFTAKAVRNAGGGSRRKGAAKMYKLMKSLENGPLGSK